MSSYPVLKIKVKHFFFFLFDVQALYNGSFFSLGRPHGLLMYINMTVISVMTYKLNVVLHILIGEYVSVVRCYPWGNKYLDISSSSTADGIFNL